MVIIWFVDLATLWMAGSVLGSLTLQAPAITSQKLSFTPGKGDEPNMNLEKMRMDLETSPSSE